jgi:hypothetical protein
MFAPSTSFAQSDGDNPLSSFFEIFSQIFSGPNKQSEPVEEFGQAAVIQTSGTSSTTDTTPKNILPIADAGTNQTVMEFANVTLDGTSSTDVDGTITSYNWMQTLGQNITLSNSTSPIASFVAPSVNGTEIFEFLLTVMDNSNATDTDTVRVTVNQKDEKLPENIPPLADAGANQTVMEFANVTLDGTSSTDPDGTITSYSWTQVSGPSNVTITNSTKAIATFEAPSVNGTEIFEFLLAVVDNSSATDTDTVRVTVNEKDDGSGGGQNNLPPIADAGYDQTVMESQDVFLDGTNSTDPDGTIESYQWSQVSGPEVILLNNNTAVATFEAPSVNATTILQFMLDVEDNSNATDSDLVSVTVNDKVIPDDPKDDDDQKDNVLICHVPPGNPDAAHTISVGSSSVDVHLGHGDSLGECPDELESEDQREQEKQAREDQREQDKQAREDQREQEKQAREDQRDD